MRGGLLKFFTPLVMASTGGLGCAPTAAYKRLANLISLKCGKPYSCMMGWIRCHLSFSLLRSSIMCIRGARFSRGCAASSCGSPTDLVLAKSRVPNLLLFCFIFSCPSALLVLLFFSCTCFFTHLFHRCVAFFFISLLTPSPSLLPCCLIFFYLPCCLIFLDSSSARILLAFFHAQNFALSKAHPTSSENRLLVGPFQDIHSTMFTLHLHFS